MYDKILVPLDGSKLAEEAVDLACKALNDGGELVLCRVLISEPMLGWEPVPFESMLEKEEAAAREYLDDVAAKLKVAVKKLIRPGPVADTLLHISDEEGVELIVLSSHGRSGAARWFLGSVAERVVRGAKCPVLVGKSKV